MRVFAPSRRGFTLVELLVALAIISVLAGLLFPVFASARRSAQGTRCLANFKNATAAALLYANDYDDRLMPTNHRPGLPPDPVFDRTWPQLLQPYIRDFRTFDCPSDPNAMEFGGSFDPDLLPGDYVARYYTASLHSDLGYNAYYLSPVVRVGDQWAAQPRTVTELSSALLFIESRSEGGGYYTVAPPCRYIVDHNRWIDTFATSAGRPSNQPEAIYTDVPGWSLSEESSSVYPYGGAWPRHSGRASTSRLDGSARNMSLSQLMQGCEVQPNWSGSIKEPSRYIWNAVL